MTNDIAISVRDVSKKFRLFDSPHERLIEALHPFRKQYHREFWALQNITFDVNRGETIGILGRNGSGKSTLLQIICSVMRPTQGGVHVNGRVSAILELGAGFNPQFTGRDNAILNGAILGLDNEEILSILPSIESFADIGEFFNQPVKTYSSGMYARLAFACAINVDPDILVIDEALSVGDAKFQNKCFMQFQQIQAKGKTVVFVSHNTESILRTCSSALLIDHGKLIAQGEPQAVVDRYYKILFPSGTDNKRTNDSIDACGYQEIRTDFNEGAAPSLLSTSGACEMRNTYNKNEFRFGDREVEIADYQLVVGQTNFPVEIRSGSMVSLYVRLKANKFEGLLSAGFALKGVDGVKLFGANTISTGITLPRIVSGQSLWVRFDFCMNIGAGDVFVDLGCGDWSNPPARPLDRRHSVLHLRVTTTDKFDGLSNCFARVSVPEFRGAASLER